MYYVDWNIFVEHMVKSEEDLTFETLFWVGKLSIDLEHYWIELWKSRISPPSNQKAWITGLTGVIDPLDPMRMQFMSPKIKNQGKKIAASLIQKLTKINLQQSWNWYIPFLFKEQSTCLCFWLQCALSEFNYKFTNYYTLLQYFVPS